MRRRGWGPDPLRALQLLLVLMVVVVAAYAVWERLSGRVAW